MDDRATSARRGLRPLSRRQFIQTGLTAGAGLGLGLTGCARKPPNVVLVSLDTLRPDRLHCYGNPRHTSPCVDRLAREGVRFSNAFTTSPWTLPAHLGLFTAHEPGKYFQSVVERNNPYPIFYKHQNETPTIASTLRDRGYATAGFHGAMLLDSVWGFDHGFDTYKNLAATDRQFGQAAGWVREHAGNRPFFLFAHNYEIHRPYTEEFSFGSLVKRPSELWRMDFAGERLEGHDLTPLDERSPLYGWKPSPDAIDYFKTVYDGGIRKADDLLQELIDALKDTGQYDNTLIVVVSDHGEEFWEHIPERSPDHDHSVFDEQLRVPLILKLPGGEHAGAVIDSMARTIDVAPTIFEVTGAPLHAAATGESLMPDVRHGGIDVPPRTLYAGQTYQGPTRVCLRTDRHKYIYCPQTVSFKPHFEVPQEALYDLVADRGEQRNIAAEQPGLVAELRSQLNRRWQTDLPLSLSLDDPLTRQYLPAMGLTGHAQQLYAAGRRTASLPDMNDASPEMQQFLEVNRDPEKLQRFLEELRSLGYAN